MTNEQLRQLRSRRKALNKLISDKAEVVKVVEKQEQKEVTDEKVKKTRAKRVKPEMGKPTDQKD